MMSLAVRTRQLTRRFGSRPAVSQLDLEIPQGSIFGLLGPNGAGKTTTLHMLLNLLQPSQGSAEVLGVDSRRLGPRQLQSIGYLSEEQQIPGWMTVEQLVDYCRPLYPGWDDRFCRRLLQRLQLPSSQKIRTLSRGMRVKAALLTALAPRPRLLILDEPFGGLDALVREEMIRAILELAGEDGWTVVLSSHDLHDIENLLLQVAFLDQGRLVLQEEMETLRERFGEVIVSLPDGAAAVWPHPRPPGWIRLEASPQSLSFVHSDCRSSHPQEQVRRLIPGCGPISVRPLSLREIFVALASESRASQLEKTDS